MNFAIKYIIKRANIKITDKNPIIFILFKNYERRSILENIPGILCLRF